MLLQCIGCDAAPASQVCASAAEGPLGPGDRGTGRSLHAVHVVALALASLAAVGAPHVSQLATHTYFLVLVSVISAASLHAIMDWSVFVAPGGMKHSDAAAEHTPAEAAVHIVLPGAAFFE